MKTMPPKQWKKEIWKYITKDASGKQRSKASRRLAATAIYGPNGALNTLLAFGRLINEDPAMHGMADMRDDEAEAHLESLKIPDDGISLLYGTDSKRPRTGGLKCMLRYILMVRVN